MHELGIMMELVRQVEQVARENDVASVEKIILQIGEMASVIPHFVRECFPAASYQTMLEKTELVIESIPANGRCRSCGQVYHLTENPSGCPGCSSGDFEILSGREFILKEIEVREKGDTNGDT